MYLRSQTFESCEGNFDVWPVISGWAWRFWRVGGLSSGRMLQDQIWVDSQYELLSSWVLNGEEREVRQTQTPAKKDLENRRDLWLKFFSRKQNGMLLLRFVLE